MRKREIACYKQFLLFSQCFLQLYILSASECDIVWLWVKCNLNIKFVFHRIENIVGKGVNADYQYFSHFPTMVSKGFFLIGRQKSSTCWIDLKYSTVETFNRSYDPDKATLQAMNEKEKFLILHNSWISYPYRQAFIYFIFLFNSFSNKPWFLRVCSVSLLKTQFFTYLENFLPLSSNSKLSSANSFVLEESKICRLGKG